MCITVFSIYGYDLKYNTPYGVSFVSIILLCGNDMTRQAPPMTQPV